MEGLIRTTMVVTGILGLALAAGCTTSTSYGVSQESGASTVFGKFDLVKNGEPVEIGGGVFGNTAKVKIINNITRQETTGRIGDGGQFAWALDPGDYHIASVSFSNRGERLEPAAIFTFTVPGNTAAVYVGTMTLETTFAAGYYGVDASIIGQSVRDECASDCARRLEELGFAEADATVALLHN